MRGYGLSDSSQVVDPPPLVSDDFEMEQASAGGDRALGMASWSGCALGSGPREDAP